MSIEIGAKIGHRTYGAGELIGWNRESGSGCGRFTQSKGATEIIPAFHAVTLEEYRNGLWWVIDGGSSIPAMPTLVGV